MNRAGGDLIGTSPVRLDGWEKVSGEARYVDDLSIPGMWVGGTVRSPVASGKIVALRRDPSFDFSRVVVVTASELPGPNVVAMIREDHPVLAADRVRFVAEPIALVAAPDKPTLAAALTAIEVDIQPGEPVLTIEDALAGKGPVWGDDNILAEYGIGSGDLEAGFAEADLIVEGTYRTGHQEHLYLETNGMVAVPRGDGGVEVIGSLQCPYYVLNALTRALSLPPEKVIVRQVATGGAFGGKEDFPSVPAAHAATLALRARHPVKIVYERTEDIRATTKRHPSRVHVRTGVKRDGTLVAADIDVVLDGGAYTTLSPVVLSRAILHAGGPYRIPNVAIRGRAVATHTAPNGAFRGFGAPQTLFAIERHMDRIASRVGVDPVTVRRRNLLTTGDQLPCGQILHEPVAAGLVLDRALALSDYEGKRGKRSPSANARTLTGVGLSVYYHGGGFTGGGEERIRGKASVRFSREGRIEILVSNVEMGQGATTVLCMIAAQALGLPLEMVTHPYPDTSRVPDTGPTVASRTTMIVGKIVVDACDALAAKLRAHLAREHGAEERAIRFADGSWWAADRQLGSFRECGLRYLDAAGPLVGDATYRSPEGLRWDEENFRGDAYKSYSWGADVVEVEVDRDTLEIRPLRATVVVEIGRAINPVLAVGQVEGGTLQALGWGYLEEIKMDAGRYLNDRVTTYIIPTTLDAPAMQVELAEFPYERGPFGAKGLGELPMDGGAPALAAAVEDATQIFAARIPITPERLLRLRIEGGGS